MAAHQAVFGPTQSGTTDLDYEVRQGRMQTVAQLANAGSRIKPLMRNDSQNNVGKIPLAAGAGSNLRRLHERGQKAEVEESHTGLTNESVGARTEE
jgi:hypothetical protein